MRMIAMLRRACADLATMICIARNANLAISLDHAQVPDLLLGFSILLAAIWMAHFFSPAPSWTRASDIVRAAHVERQCSELYDTRAQQNFHDALVAMKSALPFIRQRTRPCFRPFSCCRIECVPSSCLNLVLLAVVFACCDQTWETSPSCGEGCLSSCLCLLPDRTRTMQGQDSILLLTLLRGCSGALTTDGNCSLHSGLGLDVQDANCNSDRAVVLLWRRWRFLTGFALSDLGSLASCV